MPCGNEVVVVATLLVEGAKLDETVAHDVGVGRQACAHLVHGVFRHLVPVLTVAVDHLQLAAILGSNGCRHLQVFLGGAVPLLLFLRPNLNIETVGVQSLSRQFVDHDGTVDTTRQQHGYALVLQFVYVHGYKGTKKKKRISIINHNYDVPACTRFFNCC